MTDLPFHMIAFGLADRVLEPFCYGCAVFVVSYRFTQAPMSKVVALIAGIFLFLWMDDIWPRIGFQEGKMGLAAGDPQVADLLSGGDRLGTAQYRSGEITDLFAMFRIDLWDIASAVLFVPLGFLLGLRCSRRLWDEEDTAIQIRHGCPVANYPALAQPQQSRTEQLIQPHGGPHMRIHVIPKHQQKQEASLEEINQKLARGELDGDEPAWTAGLTEWKSLNQISGVVLPAPPPLPDLHNTTPPPFNPPIPTMHPSAVNTQPARILTEAPSSPGPKGVGGWLAFFCVGLVILGPLYCLGQMVSTWEQSKPAFDSFPGLESAIIIENLGTSALLLYGFIVGIMIWSGNSAGPRLARNYLLIRLFAFAAIEVLALIVMSDLPSKSISLAVGGVIGAVVREICYFLIWWFYFKKSKRVRNTYSQ